MRRGSLLTRPDRQDKMRRWKNEPGPVPALGPVSALKRTDVGLYVHVPFCPSKCGYCDFYSQVPTDNEIDPTIDALLAEMRQAVDARPLRVDTIFVGGGTPTSLPLGALGRLLGQLAGYAREHGVREFTVEANPGTLDEDKATLLHDSGVNRISLGAQSFNEDELRVLDRIHQPDQITQAAGLVHRMGFAHFNMDLIFGIPGQTAASWKESLARGLDLGPNHLACYGLTYEPGTLLHAQRQSRQIVPMHEHLEAEMYEMADTFITGLGFEHYEISNYARPDGRCRHNLRYWHNEPTIGIGPSAASYLDGRRWRNVEDTAEYVRRFRVGEPPEASSEALSPSRRAGETAMLMLRLTDGIPCGRFQEMTGFDPHELFAAAIDRHRKAGLLTADGDRIALTPTGRLVGDSVMADFLDPHPGAAPRATLDTKKA
ncbi:MAG TPA: radical SAM family heme chaperone HemW [Phycisphaerae bacterium]|nr:radical SAM family heme chaperone HemW [Phycisphaerae bacterium]